MHPVLSATRRQAKERALSESQHSDFDKLHAAAGSLSLPLFEAPA